MPAHPNDLLAQGYKETTTPKQQAAGHRLFHNPTTGDDLRLDYAKPGKGGFREKDHYHRKNPNSSKNNDEHLDKNSNPIAKDKIIPSFPKRLKMTTCNDLMFFDYSIRNIIYNKENIDIIFCNIVIDEDSDTFTDAVIKYFGVKSLLRDGEPVQSLKMEGDRGDVLGFDTTDNRVDILINWESFNPKRTETHDYVIYFDHMECEISDKHYTIE